MTRTTPIFTPPTPGEVLTNHVIGVDGLTQDRLARAMGVSRLTVNQLANNKRSVTHETALRLAQVLSTTPDFWLNLQHEHDMLAARRKLNGTLHKLTVLRKPGEIGAR